MKGGVRLCFRDPEGNKQTKPLAANRLYLKMKLMSIKYADKDIYAGIWESTGLNSEPRNHYFVYFLLCVKDCGWGPRIPILGRIAIENSGDVARISVLTVCLRFLIIIKQVIQIGTLKVENFKDGPEPVK